MRFKLSYNHIIREKGGKALKVDTKKLAVSAMLITLDLVFTRILAINTPLMKIGFGFAAVAASAILYGPLWAMLTAAISDVVGGLLFPVGAFFIGFTVTASVTGLIFGLCLYKRRERWMPLLAAGLNCLLVTLVANTALIAYISGSNFLPLFVTRIAQFFVMFPVQALVLSWMFNSGVMDRVFGKRK